MTDNYPNAIVLQHLAKTLLDLIEGRTGLTEGVRNVVQWRFSNHGLSEDLFLDFVGVESETDSYPLGDVREQWGASELANADRERESREESYREPVIVQARELYEAILSVSSNSSVRDFPSTPGE